MDDPAPCTKKCVCAEGYYRNSIGQCITGAQCDQCNADNEFYSCSSACDNVCIDIDRQNRTRCPIKNIQCNKRCYCDDGYARDAQKNCVPIEQCPKTGVPVHRVSARAVDSCGPNEYYTCRKPCPPETCFSLVARIRCDDKQLCRPQCACKPGFLRVRQGSPCVPICDCPEMTHSPDCRKNYIPTLGRPGFF